MWGESRGGHAVLSAARAARTYLPEADLVAVAAAAQASDLVALMRAQWSTPLAWVLASEVLVAWPTAYPDVDPAAVTTGSGQDRYAREARRCVSGGALSAQILGRLGASLFRVDPSSQPAFRRAATENTPADLPLDLPIFIAQGLADQVVPPGVQAGFVTRECRRGADLTLDWLGETGHVAAGPVSGTAATAWLAQRFAGVRAPGNCDVPAPPIPAPG